MKHFVTTAISYPNGKPHLGHAYEAVLADARVRYYRSMGEPVRFLTGTDEHGLKIAQKARAEGITPKALVDREVVSFQDMLGRLGVLPDRFIRTTDADHYASAANLWQKMVDAGDIYLGYYKGWYCVAEECYVDEDDLVVNDHGEYQTASGFPVVWNEEESWFFRLSKYQIALRGLIGYRMDIVPRSRRNEVLEMLDRGLNDISISRTSFNWGVPVPESHDHVMYVWVDALANYLTGSLDEDEEWWVSSKVEHIIGKDIIKFHALYWPAFLMSAGIKTPERIYAHGFWMNEGRKMSKSLGNVIDPIELVDQYGSDAVRYYMLAEVTFGNDGDFSHDRIKQRINIDLANSWGNLVQRTCSIIAKNYEEWPKLPDGDNTVAEAVNSHFAEMKFSTGISEWLKRVYECNQYISEKQPWALIKQDREEALSVLTSLLRSIHDLNEAIAPIIPDASARLREYLNGTLTAPTPLFAKVD